VDETGIAKAIVLAVLFEREQLTITIGSTSGTEGKLRPFLREQGVTLASIDGPPADTKHFTIMPAVNVITDPRLAYLRLHGRDPKACLTGKTVAELPLRLQRRRTWADRRLGAGFGSQSGQVPRGVQQQRMRLRASCRRTVATVHRATDAHHDVAAPIDAGQPALTRSRTW
jgi:hypothetical protein